MPREAHIERQVEWKQQLTKHGFRVTLEKTVRIRNAPVIVDVFAVLDGKKYLVEIGDIADKRKIALMQIYAEQNHNVEFIHEGYGQDKIQTVLQSSKSYKNSPEHNDYLSKKVRTKNIFIVWTALCFFGFIFCLYFGMLVEDNNLTLSVLMFLVPVIWYYGLKAIPPINKNPL